MRECASFIVKHFPSPVSPERTAGRDAGMRSGLIELCLLLFPLPARYPNHIAKDGKSCFNTGLKPW